MSKTQYLKAINQEIEKLNEVIDLKIIKDLDYKREARRHKKLLAEIRKRGMRQHYGWLGYFLTPSWF